jgi:cellulose synthase/poly-beta-1,6-N-acetylglucosamine synthase-like glycosyltransferase
MDITLTDIVLYTTYFLLLFISIFWMIVLFTKKKKEKIVQKGELPLCSVIVPAFNEEESIEGTLQSIIGLEYPKEKLDIVVVNDGSKDTTQKVVEKFITNNPSYKITLLNQQNQGKGTAMNHGLQYAKGEFFACLDADSFVGSQALQVMTPFFQEKNVAAVCPLLKVKKPDSILRKMQWVEYIINMFYRFLNAQLDCVHVTPGPFSVYRTSVIKKLGGFDEETITEDLEIAIRLQKHHYKIVHTFDAIVETIAPNSWRGLFRQRVRWYKGSIDNGFKYRRMIFNKEYGDFGMLRMPTIMLSAILPIVLAGTLLQEVFTSGIEWFYSLKSINFDIFTLIRNFQFDPNLLTLPLGKLFIAGTLFAFSFFIMILSYRVIKEKISNHGKTWVSLITYLSFYGLFLTAVWVYIGYMYVSKKKNFWH